MSTYTTYRLDDAEDIAPGHGLGEVGEIRFLRNALGAERIGMGHYRMKPGRRIAFGHRHGESEEVYLVLEGSGRFNLDGEVVDVAPGDTVYCPAATMRAWEAGDDGMVLVAFGAHTEGEDSHLEPGWWPEG